MKPWTRPPNYIGANWHGWLVFLSRTRDSSLLENHNFEVALAALKQHAIQIVDALDEDNELSSVQVVSENHFACGWVEWIAIHLSSTSAIHFAELLEAKLENYPILSEMEYSQKQLEGYWETWKDCGHSEFIRELERAELIEEGACDEVELEASRQAFESLIPSGEYYDEEGYPKIRLAIANTKRNGLSESSCQFLNLQFEKAS